MGAAKEDGALVTVVARQLPSALQNYLHRYELRHQWQRVVRRVGLALFVTIVWGMAWCFVDRLIALPPIARVLLLGVNIAAACAIIGRGVIRLLLPIDWIHWSDSSRLRVLPQAPRTRSGCAVPQSGSSSH